ncbi:hypothetical protein [Angelakisella massiliensis]|uniref:hypothetical protein n=1 Tax=Angelakisella massiliensis TaxID=1871018 RepID=UPI0024B0904A|nr:hypothetical protein [Angelakisella massiliensis]
MAHFQEATVPLDTPQIPQKTSDDIHGFPTLWSRSRYKNQDMRLIFYDFEFGLSWETCFETDWGAADKPPPPLAALGGHLPVKAASGLSGFTQTTGERMALTIL